MNNFSRILACAAMLTAAASAQATTYEFSYTLLDNTKVNGTFDGIASGNLITGLSNFSAFVNGVGFANNGSLFLYGGPATGFAPGYAVMSFNGLATDVTVSNNDLFAGGAQSLLLIGRFNGGPTDAVNFNTQTLNGGEGNGDYSAARWHLAEVTAAVPEPETYAMLLGGLALMGAVVRRNRAVS
jgi:hypothetical protein